MNRQTAGPKRQDRLSPAIPVSCNHTQPQPNPQRNHKQPRATNNNTHNRKILVILIIYNTLLSRPRATTSQVSQKYIPSSRGVPACDVATAFLWTAEHLCNLESVVKNTTPTTRLRRVVFVAFYDLHHKNTKHITSSTHTYTYTRQINTPHTKDNASQCSWASGETHSETKLAYSWQSSSQASFSLFLQTQLLGAEVSKSGESFSPGSWPTGNASPLPCSGQKKSWTKNYLELVGTTYPDTLLQLE